MFFFFSLPFLSFLERKGGRSFLLHVSLFSLFCFFSFLICLLLLCCAGIALVKEIPCIRYCYLHFAFRWDSRGGIQTQGLLLLFLSHLGGKGGTDLNLVNVRFTLRQSPTPSIPTTFYCASRVPPGQRHGWILTGPRGHPSLRRYRRCGRPGTPSACSNACRPRCSQRDVSEAYTPSRSTGWNSTRIGEETERQLDQLVDPFPSSSFLLRFSRW